MFPLAYVYPRKIRAIRDLMRRCMRLMRKRSELLAHIHNTTSQYNHPQITKNLRYAANREGVAERFEDVCTQKSIILSLVIRYKIENIHRFPRVQDFVSYCRLVRCKRESAGKTYGTGGKKCLVQNL